MANNNVNNQQPVNAIDDPDLQAATILAQIAAPNNLQQQLEAERARYQALALRKYSIEIRFDTLNRLIHQRLLHIQAGLQQAQEDQQSLDLDIEVIEEENQNLRERLQAIIDENHDLQQRSNRDNAEIARLRQENQRLQSSTFSQEFVLGLIAGLQHVHNEKVLELQRQLAAGDQEPPKEQVKDEESENDVKEESSEEKDVKTDDDEGIEA